ncbi:hypothetical protein IMSHALPRED_010755 [Imshaugia aleurites]|uniref:aldehyde dehydrogenase (NAD(+)) n=1 Tax=Imshaugia aleurites TaxID=172621 RepID=A0A8H3GB59_9LECA|nr:hypothetical protein IMSHALPRED_010755 [Imshaugia aleurites]
MPSSDDSRVLFDSFFNNVNGRSRDAPEHYHGVNPATREPLWNTPVATNEDVNDAVLAAENAFHSWSIVPFEKRAKLLEDFAELYASYEKGFTELLVRETGKPKWEIEESSKDGSAKSGALAESLHLPVEVLEDEETIVTTRYVPLGVVAAICPWNYPLVLSVAKIAPAILTGNCVIVKPSPYAPYTALKLVEIAAQIFPPGVVQVLGGNEKLGPWLVDHPGIQKISFTGSVASGKIVAREAAKTLKRVTLELGGNDASIILPDVDVISTARQVTMGAFRNTGQVCLATKRIYIHASIYRPFLDAMHTFAQAMKVGEPDDPDVELGPLQNEMQFRTVKALFDDTRANGFKFAAGTSEIPDSLGFFVSPAIIDDPPSDSRIVTEEPFGPIVPCQPWTDEEDVIARANDTKTGLGACVWGKDTAKAKVIGRRLQAGSVFINSFEKPRPDVVVAGHKESGIGGEGGRLGLLPYCNPQAIHEYK